MARRSTHLGRVTTTAHDLRQTTCQGLSLRESLGFLEFYQILYQDLYYATVERAKTQQKNTFAKQYQRLNSFEKNRFASAATYQAMTTTNQGSMSMRGTQLQNPTARREQRRLHQRVPRRH